MYGGSWSLDTSAGAVPGLLSLSLGRFPSVHPSGMQMMLPLFKGITGHFL